MQVMETITWRWHAGQPAGGRSHNEVEPHHKKKVGYHVGRMRVRRSDTNNGRRYSKTKKGGE